MPITFQESMKNRTLFPKVLIAAPIGGLKQYSLGIWLEWIAKQDYPAEFFDICICTNGADQEELAKKINETEIEYSGKRTKHIILLPLEDSNELTVVQKITYSREKIRRYAVSKDYDYIFFLDTDTIPFTKDAIRKLIAWNQQAVSGLYFYKESKVTVVVDKETNTNLSVEKCQEFADKKQLIEVWGFGFGCLLLHRTAFKICEFNYDLFGEERSDDFGYCHVLEQKGIKRFCDPSVVCKHFKDTAVSAKVAGLNILVASGKRFK